MNAQVTIKPFVNHLPELEAWVRFSFICDNKFSAETVVCLFTPGRDASRHYSVSEILYIHSLYLVLVLSLPKGHTEKAEVPLSNHPTT